MREAAEDAWDDGVTSAADFGAGLRNAGWQISDGLAQPVWTEVKKTLERAAAQAQGRLPAWAPAPPKPAAHFPKDDRLLRKAATDALNASVTAVNVFLPGLRRAGWQISTARTQPVWREEKKAWKARKKAAAQAQGRAPGAGEETESSAMGVAGGVPRLSPVRDRFSTPAEARPRAMPTFTLTSSVQELDQARRVTRYEHQGAAEQPLGSEELLITGWSTIERRLVFRAQSDEVFPWRDNLDPLNRPFAPFADEQGGLHPAVRVLGVRIAPHMRRYLVELAVDDPRLNLTGPVADLVNGLEQDVRNLVAHTIEGNNHPPPRMVARILEPGDLPAHEQILVGQYGAFLTEQMQTAPPENRPLLSEGRVLGLYPGAVLDNDNAIGTWRQVHPAYPDYAMNIDNRSGRSLMMSSEGFAGVAAFANTRLLPDGEPDLRPAGINAEFLPFHVQLTNNRGQVRWQTIVAMVALDNLYSDHNPSGMVIVDYGPSYQMRAPQVKPEPDSDLPVFTAASGFGSGSGPGTSSASTAAAMTDAVYPHIGGVAGRGQTFNTSPASTSSGVGDLPGRRGVLGEASPADPAAETSLADRIEWVNERTGPRPTPGPPTGARTGALTGVVITAEELKHKHTDAAKEARRWLDAQARQTPWRRLEVLQEKCLAYLQALADQLFPLGIASSHTRDDAALPTDARTRRLLGRPPTDWTAIPDWETLADRVKALGPGAAGLVIEARPGAIGHAFALINTRDGLYVADDNGVIPLNEYKGKLRAPFQVRALFLNANGQPAPDPTSHTPTPSADAAGTDRSTTRGPAPFLGTETRAVITTHNSHPPTPTRLSPASGRAAPAQPGSGAQLLEALTDKAGSHIGMHPHRQGRSHTPDQGEGDPRGLDQQGQGGYPPGMPPALFTPGAGPSSQPVPAAALIDPTDPRIGAGIPDSSGAGGERREPSSPPPSYRSPSPGSLLRPSSPQLPDYMPSELPGYKERDPNDCVTGQVLGACSI